MPGFFQPALLIIVYESDSAFSRALIQVNDGDSVVYIPHFFHDGSKRRSLIVGGDVEALECIHAFLFYFSLLMFNQPHPNYAGRWEA